MENPQTLSLLHITPATMFSIFETCHETELRTILVCILNHVFVRLSPLSVVPYIFRGCTFKYLEDTHTVDGTMMEQILHQLIGSLSQQLFTRF